MITLRWVYYITLVWPITNLLRKQGERWCSELLEIIRKCRYYSSLLEAIRCIFAKYFHENIWTGVENGKVNEGWPLRCLATPESAVTVARGHLNITTCWGPQSPHLPLTSHIWIKVHRVIYSEKHIKAVISPAEPGRGSEPIWNTWQVSAALYSCRRCVSVRCLWLRFDTPFLYGV